MAERNACGTCSVASVNGVFSVKVLVGDGNCTYCIANRPAGDTDEPYKYHRPTSDDHFPFNDAQYARLLAYRGKVQDRVIAKHVPDEDGL
jgi:hypothetical protein